MPFPARYPGRCDAGDDTIRVNDQIVRDEDGNVSHLRCIQITDEPTAPGDPVCSRCGLMHPGECF